MPRAANEPAPEPEPEPVAALTEQQVVRSLTAGLVPTEAELDDEAAADEAAADEAALEQFVSRAVQQGEEAAADEEATSVAPAADVHSTTSAAERDSEHNAPEEYFGFEPEEYFAILAGIFERYDYNEVLDLLCFTILPDTVCFHSTDTPSFSVRHALSFSCLRLWIV